MISEITFSKRFTSFWNEALPNANNYIRLINAGQVQATHKPLSPAPRKHNVALINVLAFEIYRSLVSRRTEASALSSPTFFRGRIFTSALKGSRAYIDRFGSFQSYKLPFSTPEQRQLKEIVGLLVERYGPKKSPVVDPKFDGCGFVDQCFGDILIGKRLVEVKSGERSFSVSDLRQILVYCTLNHYSKTPFNIDSIEIFNPRMGTCFSEKVETVALRLSALNSGELFAEIQRFISDGAFAEVVEG